MSGDACIRKKNETKKIDYAASSTLPLLMLLHYAQGDPLWIIVACRQIKNKRAPEQISTDAVTLVARAGRGRGGVL